MTNREQNFRQIVQTAMTRRGITQMELSKKSGVAQETLSSWFLGINQSIGSLKLQRIFKVLKIRAKIKKVVKK